MEIGLAKRFILAAFIVTVSLDDGVQSSLTEFAKMIKCATGRSSLLYNGYGCWCGLGGKGAPVDAIDICCQAHDRCWEAIHSNRDCSWWRRPHLEVYELQTVTSDPGECSITCDSENNKCEAAVCECDRKAALCFKENDGPFKINLARKYDYQCIENLLRPPTTDCPWNKGSYTNI